MRFLHSPLHRTDRFGRLVSLTRPGGFTLIELLTVMTIIAVLTGLVLAVAGFATKKSAMARAQTEVTALGAACTQYQADNGSYPRQALADSTGTIQAIRGNGSNVPSDQLDPRTNGNSLSTNASYANASLELYEALTGDVSCTGTGGGVGTKNYISEGFKADVYGRQNPSLPVSTSNTVQYLSDPFGNCYGYSTACATTVTSGSSPISGAPVPPGPGFNPTFDLWCTGGQTGTPSTTPGSTGDVALQWIKNW